MRFRHIRVLLSHNLKANLLNFNLSCFWTGQDDILGDIITDVYGPVSLVSKMGKSTFSVRAMTYCDLHKIKIEDLCEILQFYPEFAADFLHNFRVTFNLRLQVIRLLSRYKILQGQIN